MEIEEIPSVTPAITTTVKQTTVLCNIIENLALAEENNKTNSMLTQFSILGRGLFEKIIDEIRNALALKDTGVITKKLSELVKLNEFNIIDLNDLRVILELFQQITEDFCFDYKFLSSSKVVYNTGYFLKSKKKCLHIQNLQTLFFKRDLYENLFRLYYLNGNLLNTKSSLNEDLFFLFCDKSKLFKEYIDHPSDVEDIRFDQACALLSRSNFTEGLFVYFEIFYSPRILLMHDAYILKQLFKAIKESTMFSVVFIKLYVPTLVKGNNKLPKGLKKSEKKKIEDCFIELNHDITEFLLNFMYIYLNKSAVLAVNHFKDNKKMNELAEKFYLVEDAYSKLVCELFFNPKFLGSDKKEVVDNNTQRLRSIVSSIDFGLRENSKHNIKLLNKIMSQAKKKVMVAKNEIIMGTKMVVYYKGLKPKYIEFNPEKKDDIYIDSLVVFLNIFKPLVEKCFLYEDSSSLEIVNDYLQISSSVFEVLNTCKQFNLECQYISLFPSSPSDLGKEFCFNLNKYILENLSFKCFIQHFYGCTNFYLNLIEHDHSHIYQQHFELIKDQLLSAHNRIDSLCKDSAYDILKFYLTVLLFIKDNAIKRHKRPFSILIDLFQQDNLTFTIIERICKIIELVSENDALRQLTVSFINEVIQYQVEFFPDKYISSTKKIFEMLFNPIIEYQYKNHKTVGAIMQIIQSTVKTYDNECDFNNRIMKWTLDQILDTGLEQTEKNIFEIPLKYSQGMHSEEKAIYISHVISQSGVGKKDVKLCGKIKEAIIIYLSNSRKNFKQLGVSLFEILCSSSLFIFRYALNHLNKKGFSLRLFDQDVVQPFAEIAEFVCSILIETTQKLIGELSTNFYSSTCQNGSFIQKLNITDLQKCGEVAEYMIDRNNESETNFIAANSSVITNLNGLLLNSFMILSTVVCKKFESSEGFDSPFKFESFSSVLTFSKQFKDVLKNNFDLLNRLKILPKLENYYNFLFSEIHLPKYTTSSLCQTLNVPTSCLDSSASDMMKCWLYQCSYIMLEANDNISKIPQDHFVLILFSQLYKTSTFNNFEILDSLEDRANSSEVVVQLIEWIIEQTKAVVIKITTNKQKVTMIGNQLYSNVTQLLTRLSKYLTHCHPVVGDAYIEAKDELGVKIIKHIFDCTSQLLDNQHLFSKQLALELLKMLSGFEKKISIFLLNRNESLHNTHKKSSINKAIMSAYLSNLHEYLGTLAANETSVKIPIFRKSYQLLEEYSSKLFDTAYQSNTVLDNKMTFVTKMLLKTSNLQYAFDLNFEGLDSKTNALKSTLSSLLGGALSNDLRISSRKTYLACFIALFRKISSSLNNYTIKKIEVKSQDSLKQKKDLLREFFELKIKNPKLLFEHKSLTNPIIFVNENPHLNNSNFIYWLVSIQKYQDLLDIDNDPKLKRQVAYLSNLYETVSPFFRSLESLELLIRFNINIAESVNSLNSSLSLGMPTIKELSNLFEVTHTLEYLKIEDILNFFDSIILKESKSGGDSYYNSLFTTLELVVSFMFLILTNYSHIKKLIFWKKNANATSIDDFESCEDEFIENDILKSLANQIRQILFWPLKFYTNQTNLKTDKLIIDTYSLIYHNFPYIHEYLFDSSVDSNLNSFLLLDSGDHYFKLNISILLSSPPLNCTKLKLNSLINQTSRSNIFKLLEDVFNDVLIKTKYETIAFRVLAMYLKLEGCIKYDYYEVSNTYANLDFLENVLTIITASLTRTAEEKKEVKWLAIEFIKDFKSVLFFHHPKRFGLLIADIAKLSYLDPDGCEAKFKKVLHEMSKVVFRRYKGGFSLNSLNLDFNGLLREILVQLFESLAEISTVTGRKFILECIIKLYIANSRDISNSLVNLGIEYFNKENLTEIKELYIDLLFSYIFKASASQTQIYRELNFLMKKQISPSAAIQQEFKFEIFDLAKVENASSNHLLAFAMIKRNFVLDFSSEVGREMQDFFRLISALNYSKFNNCGQDSIQIKKNVTSFYDQNKKTFNSLILPRMDQDCSDLITGLITNKGYFT